MSEITRTAPRPSTTTPTPVATAPASEEQSKAAAAPAKPKEREVTSLAGNAPSAAVPAVLGGTIKPTTVEGSKPKAPPAATAAAPSSTPAPAPAPKAAAPSPAAAAAAARAKELAEIRRVVKPLANALQKPDAAKEKTWPKLPKATP
jgi:hypothetical protein